MPIEHCDKPTRAAFLAEVANHLTALATKHGLEISVQQTDPIVIGIRGCLKAEPVELMLFASGDLRAASRGNLSGNQATQVQTANVARFVDTAEIANNPTVAKAQPMPTNVCG